MTITPADMRNDIYVSRSYNANGTTVPGPALKTAGGVVGNAEDKGEHFMVDAGRKYSFEVRREGTEYGVYFKPPAAGPGGTNAVYLPFLANNNSSAVIDTTDQSISHFFTDGLSGCSIFIDTLPNQIIVHHANFAAQSPTAEETKANPAYERPSAVAIMQGLHDTSVDNAYNGATARASLFKSQYNATGRGFVQRQRALGRSDADFWGGTNVIGFRVGAGWQFWYQTFASTTTGGTRDIIDCQQFY